MSYQDVKDKLYYGHRKIANNTYLTIENLGIKPMSIHDVTDAESIPHPEHIDMKLHGNTVARFYPDHLKLYSAGWYTTTTKRRLNLALELANCPQGVGQHNHTWYLYGKHEFYDGIKIDYTGEVIN